MASEYLKWKYRDIQPEEKTELTPAQKRRNWWHYHKWHVLIGAVLLLALLDIGRGVLGIGAVRPDYQVAYVASAPLPEDTVAALESAFAALGEDVNGDDKVVVQLNQYVSDGSDSNEAAAYTAANEVKLMADLEHGDSCFFILESPETFQINHQILRRLDGTLPAGYESSFEDCYLAWRNCPVLSSMKLGAYSTTILGEAVSGDSQRLLSELYFARRGYWAENKNAPQYDALWDILTKGAIS